jgi:hypothetical protein
MTKFRWGGLVTVVTVALPLALTQGYTAQAAASPPRPYMPAVAANAAPPAPAGRIAARPDAGGGDGCNPGRTNDFRTFRFDGWERSPGTTVGGVYSDIYNYSPWVYYITSTTSYVSAWSLVDDGYHYAQVGWIEEPHGARYVFTETFDRNGDNVRYFSPEPINSQSYYTVLFNNTPGEFTFEVNGSVIDVSTAQFTPNDGQNYGETHSLADQMPGGYNQNEYFSNTHIWYSGAWHNFSGTPHNDSSHYGDSKPSSTEMLIWDWACPN